MMNRTIQHGGLMSIGLALLLPNPGAWPVLIPAGIALHFWMYCAQSSVTLGHSDVIRED